MSTETPNLRPNFGRFASILRCGHVGFAPRARWRWDPKKEYVYDGMIRYDILHLLFLFLKLYTTLYKILVLTVCIAALYPIRWKYNFPIRCNGFNCNGFNFC